MVFSHTLITTPSLYRPGPSGVEAAFMTRSPAVGPSSGMRRDMQATPLGQTARNMPRFWRNTAPTQSRGRPGALRFL